ncbi:Hypothetical predicted protein [Olea europaea subsp. europaea]|uniref:Uncharacterized protein n=1 Tax=Olea europaea subsp. europaea TaxID=158383 RepID=A0A8S0TFU9_OLEEU|nr:Hypothetical predicted protein [Olea europaea subsp. europaea]
MVLVNFGRFIVLATFEQAQLVSRASIFLIRLLPQFQVQVQIMLFIGEFGQQLRQSLHPTLLDCYSMNPALCFGRIQMLACHPVCSMGFSVRVRDSINLEHNQILGNSFQLRFMLHWSFLETCLKFFLVRLNFLGVCLSSMRSTVEFQSKIFEAACFVPLDALNSKSLLVESQVATFGCPPRGFDTVNILTLRVLD